MTALVSEEGIFGMSEADLMPVVFIDRVTLKGGSDPLVVDNPHIDHEWEGTYVKDRYGNLKFKHLGHSLSRKPKTSTALTSTVDLVVKDYVSNDSLSYWFHDNEILKYMNIRVIQSRDSRLTAELNAGKMSSLKKGRYRNRYDQKIISLGVTDKELDNYYVQEETGRGELSSIPYSVTFVSKDLEPQHLSYFVFCFLNIKKLSQDYNLNLYGYDYETGIVSKRVTQETVIDNSQLVSESHAYYTPDGQIWAGPVHYHAPTRQWMAGARHTSRPHPILTRETFINATVQDFRNIQQIDGASINLKPVDTLFDRLREKYSANEIKEVKSVSYFSEAFMARASTSGGTSHFVFSFSYLDFLKDESQLGMLYESGTSTRNQILRQSKIKSIKVFRHRVSANGLFNTAGVKTNGDTFRENPYDTSVGAPTLIAQSSDGGVLSLIPARKSTKDGQPLGSIREINLGNHDTYLRSFAVTDFAADHLTDGVYKYSVEITVEDGASTFIKEQVKRLKTAIRDMTLYGELASSHGYYDSVSGRFRDSLLKYYLQETTNYQNFPWVLSLATFIDIVGYLAESDAQDMPLFRQLMSVINPRTGTPEGITAVIGLMEQLEVLMESVVGTEDILQNRVQKAVGLAQSKNRSFLEAEKMFSNIFDSEIPHKYGLDFLSSENRNTYAGPKTITFGDYGDRLIQENIKYFSPSPALYSNPIASPTIGEVSPDMLERVPSDVRQAMEDFSTYSPAYLTPANFRNGKAVLDNTVQLTEGSDSDYNKINNFCIKFLNSVFDQRSNMFSVSNSRKTDDTEKVDFLAKLGVSILPVDLYKQKIDEPEKQTSGVRAVVPAIPGASPADNFAVETLYFSNEVRPPRMTGVNEIMGAFLSESSLINSQRYSMENDKASLSSQQQQKLTKEDLYYQNWTTTLEAYQSGFTEMGATWDTAAITSIPNQIKSAFWSDEGSIRTDYQSIDYDYINNPKTANAFTLNHQVIAKIETLSAQKNSEGVVEYNWTPLTQAAFNADVEGGMLLARLVPYVENRLQVGTSRFADIPYYDTHFLLAPTEEMATQVAITPTVLSQDSTMATLLNMGKNLTQKMIRLASASYLRSTTQPRVPRNRDDRGYYDVFRRSKGNTVIRLLEETGCSDDSASFEGAAEPTVISPDTEMPDYFDPSSGATRNLGTRFELETDTSGERDDVGDLADFDQDERESAARAPRAQSLRASRAEEDELEAVYIETYEEGELGSMGFGDIQFDSSMLSSDDYDYDEKDEDPTDDPGEGDPSAGTAAASEADTTTMSTYSVDEEAQPDSDAWSEVASDVNNLANVYQDGIARADDDGEGDDVGERDDVRDFTDDDESDEALSRDLNDLTDGDGSASVRRLGGG